MDFYLILGVERDASQAEIKRAYRRLSRRYHPGINPGDRTAEEIFRRVSEAYETLADPGRRRQYDRGGRAPAAPPAPPPTLQFTEFDFSSAADGPGAATFTELFAEVLHPLRPREQAAQLRGADIHATVAIEFEEALRGVERQLVVTRQLLCPGCRGAGQVARAEALCPRCQGRGSVRWARGHMVFSKSCAECGGIGRQSIQSCRLCAGTGRTVRGEAVAVAIPPGARDGERLRLAERGHAGHHGGRNGDLYVTVTVRPHPFFRRDGDTLTCELPVAVHEAVLGARIEVPTLDGPVKLRLPPGTQAGQRFRIAGRGVPGGEGARGDLIVEVRLVLPAAVDDRSKELIREFGERNSADVRGELPIARTPSA